MADPMSDERLAEIRARVQAATMREWSAEDPDEANPCDAAEEHDCHLVAGELAFNEAIRQARKIAGTAVTP